MATLLIDKKPILVSDESGNKQLLPTPELLDKFEFLHYFLDEIVRDWERAVTPFQKEINSSPSDIEIPAALAHGFLELQPVFLKCMFSYAMFFVTIDAAYSKLYSQLNSANKISGLYIKHQKPPKRNATIEKLRTVRNLSIAHIDSERAQEIDALAAISWQPLSMSKPISKKWDLNDMAFGSLRRVKRAPDGTFLEQSQDIELPGIPSLHKKCLEYLENYDAVCSEYLESLHWAIGL